MQVAMSSVGQADKDRLTQLTLRDLEEMSRAELLEALRQITGFLARGFDDQHVAQLSDQELRRFVARALRKFQELGY